MSYEIQRRNLTVQVYDQAGIVNRALEITAPNPKPIVTGSWDGNAAGQSLCAALAGLGLITDSTS